MKAAMQDVAPVLEKEPLKFEHSKSQYKDLKSSGQSIYIEKPKEISLIKLFREYSTVEKFILYRYSIMEEKQTVEETYVLKEVRADHSQMERRVSLLSLICKGTVMFKTAQFIFNVSTSLKFALFALLYAQYLFDSKYFTRAFMLPRMAHYLRLYQLGPSFTLSQ